MSAPPVVAAAGPGDLGAVLALLADARLPQAGVAEHFAHFLVARADDQVLGAVGLEPYGEAGLLRSLVVAPRARGRGLGGALTDRLIDAARARGVRRVFLLTETAAEFFAGRGFQRIARDEADRAVRRSVEFTAACPQSAACMRLEL